MKMKSAQASYHHIAQPWVVCLTAALCFFYLFIQMTKFNAIGSQLMVDFRITSTGLGTLSSMYFWGNVIFLFPAGLLLDRFSTKKILVMVMLITAICTYLVSFTNSVSSASWYFLFTGLAGSFALIIPLRLASRWFAPEKMALASGLIITIGFCGAMVSQFPLTVLVDHIGWRTAMQLNAGLGILILALMIALIKDFPEGVTREMTHEQATSLSFLWYSIKKAIGNPQNWIFGLYTCLTNLPIFVLGAVFGANYIVQTHHITDDQAAFANTLLFIGAMAGSPAFGWLSDKMKKRKAPMYYGALISLALVFILMYATNLHYLAIYALFCGIGFFTSSQVISYPTIAESNPGETIATGLSMGSVLIMSGGAFMMPLFGWLLDLNWHGAVIDGVPIHSVADYRFALWMLPISFVVSMLAIMFGKETHCKRIV
jgi:MFS family permease